MYQITQDQQKNENPASSNDIATGRTYDEQSQDNPKLRNSLQNLKVDSEFDQNTFISKNKQIFESEGNFKEGSDQQNYEEVNYYNQNTNSNRNLLILEGEIQEQMIKETYTDLDKSQEFEFKNSYENIDQQSFSDRVYRSKLNTQQFEKESKKLVSEFESQGSLTVGQIMGGTSQCRQASIDDGFIQEGTIPFDAQFFASQQSAIYAWGLNDNNQMGNLPVIGDTRKIVYGFNNDNSIVQSRVLIPRQIQLQIERMPPIQQILCAQAHTLLISQQQSIYVLGDNSNSQLGFSALFMPKISELTQVQINRPLDSSLEQIATSSSHSLLLFNSQQENQTVLFSGLGTTSKFEQLLEFNQEIRKQSKKIQLMSVGNYFSCFIVTGNLTQELWLLDHSNQKRIKFFNLPQSQVKELKCSIRQALVLMVDGSVWRLFVDKSQEKLGLSPLFTGFLQIVAISSNKNKFALLSSENHIFILDENQGNNQEQLLKIQSNLNLSKGCNLTQISLGCENGHVIDSFGNVYGWGNNKNGELGTGDSYPRIQLTQIRFFDNNKNYIRCKSISSGESFSFGLFETINDLSEIHQKSISQKQSFISEPNFSQNINKSQQKEPSQTILSPVIPQIQVNKSLPNAAIGRNDSKLRPYIENHSQSTIMEISQNEDMISNKNPIQIKNLNRGRSTSVQREEQIVKTQQALQKYREVASDYRNNLEQMKRLTTQVSMKTIAPANPQIIQDVFNNNQLSSQSIHQSNYHQKYYNQSNYSLLSKSVDCKTLSTINDEQFSKQSEIVKSRFYEEKKNQLPVGRQEKYVDKGHSLPPPKKQDVKSKIKKVDFSYLGYEFNEESHRRRFQKCNLKNDTLLKPNEQKQQDLQKQNRQNFFNLNRQDLANKKIERHQFQDLKPQEHSNNRLKKEEQSCNQSDNYNQVPPQIFVNDYNDQQESAHFKDQLEWKRHSSKRELDYTETNQLSLIESSCVLARTQEGDSTTYTQSRQTLRDEETSRSPRTNEGYSQNQILHYQPIRKKSQDKQQVSVYKPENTVKFISSQYSNEMLSQTQINLFENFQSQMQESRQKLNKYKRKLKKYMQINQNLQDYLKQQGNELNYTKHQLQALRNQNQQQTQVQLLQDQIQQLENQSQELKEFYHQKMEELDHVNTGLQESIDQKDEQIQQLQDKFNFVESQIEELEQQLIVVNKEKQKQQKQLVRLQREKTQEQAHKQQEQQEQDRKVESLLVQQQFLMNAQQRQDFFFEKLIYTLCNIRATGNLDGQQVDQLISDCTNSKKVFMQENQNLSQLEMMQNDLDKNLFTLNSQDNSKSQIKNQVQNGGYVTLRPCSPSTYRSKMNKSQAEISENHDIQYPLQVNDKKVQIQIPIQVQSQKANSSQVQQSFRTQRSYVTQDTSMTQKTQIVNPVNLTINYLENEQIEIDTSLSCPSIPMSANKKHDSQSLIQLDVSQSINEHQFQNIIQHRIQGAQLTRPVSIGRNIKTENSFDVQFRGHQDMIELPKNQSSSFDNEMEHSKVWQKIDEVQKKLQESQSHERKMHMINQGRSKSVPPSFDNQIQQSPQFSQEYNPFIHRSRGASMTSNQRTNFNLPEDGFPNYAYVHKKYIAKIPVTNSRQNTSLSQERAKRSSSNPNTYQPSIGQPVSKRITNFQSQASSYFISPTETQQIKGIGLPSNSPTQNQNPQVIMNHLPKREVQKQFYDSKKDHLEVIQSQGSILTTINHIEIESKIEPKNEVEDVVQKMQAAQNYRDQVLDKIYKRVNDRLSKSFKASSMSPSDELRQMGTISNDILQDNFKHGFKTLNDSVDNNTFSIVSKGKQTQD